MQLTLLAVLAATAVALPAAEEDLSRRAAGLVAIPSGFNPIPHSSAVAHQNAKAKATPSAVAQVLTPLVDKIHAPVASPDEPPAERDAEADPEKRKKRATCTSPETVYEWSSSSVTAAQRLAFTQANKCLMNTAARSGMTGAVTRWDDLAAIHQSLMVTIHEVGQFLPWHRYFLWIYEQELRNTCSYTGPMLWWDETKYAGSFHTAPHFTSTYYGTLNLNNAKCVTNGVFANLACHIGPGTSETNHCLSRQGSESASSQVTTSYVNTCNSYTDFDDMQWCSGNGPHAYGHNAVGSVMADVYASPQEPDFFLHHHFINRNWRVWQGVSPSTRTYAIGGYTTQSCEANSGGSGCIPTTLQYTLTSNGFYPDITINSVMDTQGGFLCYVYDY